MNREIKFRAWSNGEMTFSKTMPDMGFWKWVSFDSTTQTMQYTGLKDNNDKEIYEGDIITHNDRKFTIHFSEEVFGFVAREINYEKNWRDGGWINNVSKYIAVVGNIYENHELLNNG